MRGRKGEFREELEMLDRKGYRVRIDGEVTEIEEGMRLEKRKNHTVEAIVDRIILKPVQATGPSDQGAGPGTDISSPEPWPPNPGPLFDTKRLQTAVVTALGLGNGLVLMGLQPSGGEYTETLFSTSMACPDCGINVPKLEPRSFSFNSTYGACPECHGIGSIYDFDQPDAAVRGTNQRAAGPPPLRPAPRRRRPARLPWHLPLPSRQHGGIEVRNLPRLHDGLYVRL